MYMHRCRACLPQRTVAGQRPSRSCGCNEGSPLSAAPTSCAVQTPLPDLSQLSPDEILTIELFKTNT